MAGDRRLSPLAATAAMTGEPQTDADDDPVPEGNEMAVETTEHSTTADVTSGSAENTIEWINNLVVGQQVDVLDSAGFWCEAEVSSEHIQLQDAVRFD